MEKLIPILLIFLFSCNSSNKENDISLLGNIDNKVNCEINLSRTENVVQGNLVNLDNNEKISLKGTVVNNHLRIEEYRDKNKLTGIFDGKYIDGVYKGFWKSPDYKVSVPFIFHIKHDSLESTGSGRSRNLESSYLKWVVQMNNGDDYCTNEECEKSDGLNTDCGLTILKEFPTEIVYADINNDGIEDAFIYAIIQPCMMGTWFINVEMAGHLVVFVSQNNGDYEIYNNPDIIVDNLKFGRIKEANGSIISGEGLGLDGETAHSLGFKWTCKFEFRNKQFYLISKSKEERYTDQ
ncbi:hypothetical protein [Altibacter sp. HG106]|uniref:hypothetical protein n=1 Tax=Altibacter sp. HG106 TaxID=3023937 RepID=UPI0023507329|nr:hypothetical protein [Altibacter sp. HG106]MDC7996357.1 hypothetical protein [Altibacter sp. HG106]